MISVPACYFSIGTMLVRATKLFFAKNYSVSSTGNLLYFLKDRALLRVDGADASHFLQGLITNDVSHLNGTPGSMFAMFLNLKGRVLCDSIIYKHEEDKFLIECDVQGATTLHKHLKMYKVRRKVNLDHLGDRRLYALWNSEFGGLDMKESFPQSSSEVRIHKGLIIFKDPRVASLGYRIIAEDTEDVKAELSNIIECTMADYSRYRALRYTLGVGEGPKELPPGNCFPLECNCDYLHGISFHKGCYLGQELTARIYHTGVIRKRLMPLVFTKTATILPEQNIIIHEGVNLGKLRGVEGNVGLGLMRVTQALDVGTVKVGNGEAVIEKPKWWPLELPKEKVNLPKM
ncbi:putative transferase CAF17 homolog, mitochondrial [Cylas formicarius]|uniref:putative transferase CAF17 homolog, mitochondrial n=1 Tax=Cylas formicarius TaxID=197179 RepID=UPI00295844F9|nr:putative transferase CAF17 homolog, mitochondrial [Cylas formicarius]